MTKENELLLKEIFQNWSFRAASPVLSTFKKEGKTATVKATITTEAPAMIVDYEKSDFWNWKIVYAREILLMSGVRMPPTRQVPLLNVHSRWRTADVRGSIRDMQTEGINLDGDVHFWSKAEDEISQVEEGHLTDLSAGYRVSEKETVILNPGEEREFNGKKYKNDFGDEMRLFIRTQWEIKEGSLVPIGADSAAKFRSELLSTEINPTFIQTESNPKIKTVDPDLQKKIDDAIDAKINSIKITGEKTMSEILTPEQLRAKQKEDVAAEVKRREDIKGAAEFFGKQYKHGETKLKEAIDLAIKEEHSVEQFKAHLMDNFDSSKAIASPGIDLSDNEKREYSISKAVLDMADGKFGQKKSSGLVKEVHDQLMKVYGDSYKQETNSFLVPPEYFGAKSLYKNDMLTQLLGGRRMGIDEFSLLQRAMDATTSGAGGINLVGDTFRPDLFIEILREKLALGAAGVTVLTGLKENFTIPRQLTDSTFALTTEGVAGSESSLTFDQLQSSPNVGTGWVEFTKQLLIQSNPSIDALIRESLMAVEMRGVDYYGLVGGGDITGLLNESGTNAVTLSGDPTWAGIVDFETEIEDDDAMIGEMKWLMSPRIKGRCKVIPKLSGSQFSGWLMETNGEMNGYPSVFSTILNRDPMDGYYLILGVFAQMMLNMWGATEIQVNPFSKDTQGIIRIVLLTYFDWIVRQPSAFCISDDVNAS